MASAHSKTRTVVKTVETQENYIVLSLSPEEAQALVDVGFRVGGHNQRTARRHIDSVTRALNGQGVFESTVLAEGNIYFKG